MGKEGGGVWGGASTVPPKQTPVKSDTIWPQAAAVSVDMVKVTPMVVSIMSPA